MKQKTYLRLLILAGFLFGLALVLPIQQKQQAQTAVSFEKTVLPFLADNCVYCHNAKKQSGGLNLESFTTTNSFTAQRDSWDHILQKIQTGEMPPKGAPKPDPAEVKRFIGYIETELARVDKLVKPDPGRVTARRLNRAEYNNTVRDLLGVDIHPADAFPQDDSGYGFDNIGDVLSLSPVLMEKYLTAAENVARTAIFGVPAMKPSVTELRSQGRKIEPKFTALLDYDTTGLSLPNALHVSYRFPVDAEYTFRLFLNGARPPASDGVKFAIWIDGQQVQVRDLDPEGGASFDDNKQVFDSFTLDFRTKVSAGDHWVAASILNMYDGLPASYNAANPSKKPQPKPPEFKDRPDLSPEINQRRRANFEAKLKEKVPVNTVRIGRVDIGGPYNQVTGASPESKKKIFICGHLDGKHQSGCAVKIISNLAHRAYRRPVAAPEIEPLVNLVAMAQKNGDTFEEGINVAIQAMLVSPHFLFRLEQDRPGTSSEISSYQISQHELASRLSYFLWSSMPDDELLRTADQGTLRKPVVLKAQIQRMLKDEKAKALVENFGGQWLELRKLESTKPDRERFPEYDDYLRMSMRRETEMFIESIVREDKSILDLIDGKYSFLNERLAELYKIPGVKGPEFRKISLANNPQRGGIITQASVLTVSSYTTRTSPVLRGKWILENILNAPPPPPPTTFNLDDSKNSAGLTLRQQLEEHRKNPTCAACHARMDPLGFGLEKFNAIGEWRTMDGNLPIDDSGLLPDGRKFNGPEELRSILRADRNAFAQGLTEKLLTYGLGRGLERYDKPTVKNIATAVAANDFRFSSLIMEIANSLPFQMRRGSQQNFETRTAKSTE